MAIFSNLMSGKRFKGLIGLTAGMIGISVAVLLLASAMAVLGNLDNEQIARGLVAIAGMMTMLVLAAKALSANAPVMIKGATGFILFAVAINILASAVKKLSELDFVDLLKGLFGVGVLLAELSIFMKMTDLSGMGIKSSIGILIMSGALVILATAVKKLSEIDLGALAKGLIAMGIILAELALFINFTVDAKKVISTAYWINYPWCGDAYIC